MFYSSVTVIQLLLLLLFLVMMMTLPHVTLTEKIICNTVDAMRKNDTYCRGTVYFHNNKLSILPDKINSVKTRTDRAIAFLTQNPEFNNFKCSCYVLTHLKTLGLPYA